MYIGELTPAQSAIFRKNVYEAVRIALGTSGLPGTPDNIKVSRIAESYTGPRIKTLSVTMSRDEILKDPAFQTMISQAGGGSTGGAAVSGGWGLMDSAIGYGIPNYALYGVATVVVGLIARKLVRGRKGKKK